MKAVGIKTLKNRLSEYARLASRGEVVLVTDRDQVGGSHGDDSRTLIGRVALLELVPSVLARALAPFPVAVRTLDALHLASLHFLREHGQRDARELRRPPRRCRGGSGLRGHRPVAIRLRTARQDGAEGACRAEPTVRRWPFALR